MFKREIKEGGEIIKKKILICIILILSICSHYYSKPFTTCFRRIHSFYDYEGTNLIAYLTQKLRENLCKFGERETVEIEVKKDGIYISGELLTDDKKTIFFLLSKGIVEFNLPPSLTEKEIFSILVSFLKEDSISSDKINFQKRWDKAFSILDKWDDLPYVIRFYFKTIISPRESGQKVDKAYFHLELLLKQRNLSTYPDLIEELSSNLFRILKTDIDKKTHLIDISFLLASHLLKIAKLKPQLNSLLSNLIEQSLVVLSSTHIATDFQREKIATSAAQLFTLIYQENMNNLILSPSLEEHFFSTILDLNASPYEIAKIIEVLVEAGKLSIIQDYFDEILYSTINIPDTLYRVAKAIFPLNKPILKRKLLDHILQSPKFDWGYTPHLINVIKIITLDPSACEDLIKYLTIHYKLHPPDLYDSLDLLEAISYLLASDIKGQSSYFLIRNLLKQIPYPFGEAGFDTYLGDLRLITQKLDPSYFKISEEPRILSELRRKIHDGRTTTDVIYTKRILAYWLSGNPQWLWRDGKRLGEAFPKRLISNLSPEDRDIEGKKEMLNLLLDLPYEGSDEFDTLRDSIKDLLKRGDYFKAIEAFANIPLKGTLSGKLLYEITRENINEKISELLDILESSLGIPKDKLITIDPTDIVEVLWMVLLYQALKSKYDVMEVFAKDMLPEEVFYKKGDRESMMVAAENLIRLRQDVKNFILSDEPVRPLKQVNRDDIGGTEHGSYSEKRLDLFNKDRYLEIHAQKLFADLGTEVFKELRKSSPDINFVVKVTSLIIQNLMISGLGGLELEHIINNLNYGDLTTQQLLNLITQLNKELETVVSWLSSKYEKMATLAVSHINPESLPPEYMEGGFEGEALFRTVGTRVITELMKVTMDVCSMGVLEEILDRFRSYLKNLPSDQIVLEKNGNFDDVIFLDEWEQETLPPTSLYGKKAVNLIKLTKMGLPIPDGFVISTEVAKDILLHPEKYEVGKSGYKELRRLVAEAIVKLEKKMGVRFGGAVSQPFLDKVRREMGINVKEQKRRPTLLLSCRSGSTFTLPGVLVTILNVGLTKENIEKIAAETKDPWAVWDAYRRYLQSFATHILGRERFIVTYPIQTESGIIEGEKLIFDEIIENAKEKAGVEAKEDLTVEQMREVAYQYEQAIKERVSDEEFALLEKDPFAQLIACIFAVIRSWNSNLSKEYRKNDPQYKEDGGIADEWLTPVIIQAMKWGTYREASGAGVLETSNLDHSSIRGIYKPKSSGPDIMLGVSPRWIPISNFEKKGAEPTLESTMRSAYVQLQQMSREIEAIFSKPQEIEFVIEKGKIYILQTREARRVHIQLPEIELQLLAKSGFAVEGGKLKSLAISFGVPNFSGGFIGRIAFTVESLEEAIEKGMIDYDFILFYDDIPPECIPELMKIKQELDRVGRKLLLVCRRGGFLSHAIEVAGSLNVPAIVKVEMSFDRQSGRWQMGDYILKDLEDILYIDDEGYIYLSNN